MSWIGIGVLIYLAICWAGSLFLIDMGSDCEGSLAPDTRQALDQIRTERPLRMFMARAAVVLFLGPLLPAIFVYGYFAERRDAIRYLEHLREYHPATFEEIHEANLPREATEQFALVEPLFLEASFDYQGTYLVKERPFEIHNRCFLSPSGDTIADVSMINGVVSYSLTSILGNGHVIETACFDGDNNFELINESGRFTATGVPWRCDAEAVANLITTHQSKLVHVTRELESECRCFGFGNLRDAMRYAHYVMDDIRFELGDLSTGPEQIDCPDGSGRQDDHDRMDSAARA